MSVFTELPAKQTPTNLADWLEITALLERKGVASDSDLQRFLKAEEDGEEDQVAASQPEIGTQAVFAEINNRARAAGKGYPFKVTGNSISRIGNVARHLPYIYCLLISYYGDTALIKFASSKWKAGNAAKVFEGLATQASAALLKNKKNSTEAINFGWPRRFDGNVANPQFVTALADLCNATGEMVPAPRILAGKMRDAGLDIVAWKKFPDGLKGSIFLMGQCAIGVNWDAKLRDVKSFEYFVHDLQTPVTYANFIPFVVDTSDAEGRETWEMHVKAGGILFDRCRIAYLVDSWKQPAVSKFCSDALEGIRKASNKEFV